MQTIIPCLWFDHVAAEAVSFYTSVFPDAQVTSTQYYPSEGLLDFQQEFADKELTVEFEIGGYRFVAINAGPEFAVNPSVSFMLNFTASPDGEAPEDLDALWAALSAGGSVLMPLGEHPFSPRYGWVQDRYGVNWQLILGRPGGDPRPFIEPSIMFAGRAQNRAGEALDHYREVFPGGRLGAVARYAEQTGPARPGDVMFSDVELLDQWFALMDSAVDQDFTFNCGVSLIVECLDQVEIDRYWDALSAVPEAEQCGWCADRFGLSWQILPVNLGELMQAPGSYERLMQMKKIDTAAFG